MAKTKNKEGKVARWWRQMNWYLRRQAFIPVAVVFLTATGIAIGGTYTAVDKAYEKIYAQKLATADKYIDLGTPETIRERLEAKSAETCGYQTVRMPVAEFGKERSFTCAGTTFKFIAKRVAKEEDIKTSCGGFNMSSRFETTESYPIEVRVSAENEKGEKAECVLPTEMGAKREHSDRCGCDFFVTSPTVHVTADRLTLRAIFSALQ